MGMGTGMGMGMGVTKGGCEKLVDDNSIDIVKNRVLAIWGVSLSQLHRILRLLFARFSWSQKSFCIDDSTVFKKENNASVCLFE